MFQANLLLGYYRKSDCADPEIFIAGVTAVLSRYPESVVAKVCDPRSGIPFAHKFLPTISEIGEACEREDSRVRRNRERDQRVAAQLAERERFEAMTDLERRREVVRRWREGLEKTVVSIPDNLDLADARKAGNEETRAFIVDHYSRKLAESAARYAATPCLLSNQARAALGFPLLTDTAG